jgi:hypothetical protein
MSRTYIIMWGDAFRWRCYIGVRKRFASDPEKALRGSQSTSNKSMENAMLKMKLPALLSLALVTFVLGGCGAKEEQKIDAAQQSIKDAAATVSETATDAADATADMAAEAKDSVHAMADQAADASSDAMDAAGDAADAAADSAHDAAADAQDAANAAAESTKEAADAAADSAKDAADTAAEEAKKAMGG